MKKVLTILCAVVIALSINANVQADTATAYVGTANGTNEFSITDGGNTLHYNPQPDTNNNWYYQDGSLVTYTRSGVTAPRDGMKTYAATSVAYGQTLSSISMSFDYAYGGTDSSGLPLKGYPSLNFCITDGAGTFAIWSATSGGTAFSVTYPTANAGTSNWYSLSMDLTTLADDSTYGKINESTNESVLENGKLNDVNVDVQWSDIKDWTIAGFYTEQFSPTGGFGAWNETLWDTISTPDDPTTTENEYTNTNMFGISLVWGDTVGGMYGDGDGEIGTAAERAYGQGSKEISNLVIGVDGTTYDVSFEAGVVPEPSTLSLLGLAGIALIRRKRK